MEKVTREELQRILIGALDQIEECKGVTSIGIYKLRNPDFSNWRPSTIDFGDADQSICRMVLPEIVRTLQEQYELE